MPDVKVTKNVAETDKGWAWVILGASFMNLLICSIGQCAGIFNMFFIREYEHESRAMVAATGVLIPALTTLSAPVSSVLISCFGAQKTLLLGATLACLGLSLTFWAQSFYHIFITFGLMSGLGLGMSYATSVYTLGLYFDNYRNLAFGIVLSAIGIGMMAFPPALDFLHGVYGIKGVILILGGISGHLFAMALLMLPFHRKEHFYHIKEDISVSKQEKERGPVEDSDIVISRDCNANTDNIYNEERNTNFEKENRNDKKLLSNHAFQPLFVNKTEQSTSVCHISCLEHHPASDKTGENSSNFCCKSMAKPCEEKMITDNGVIKVNCNTENDCYQQKDFTAKILTTIIAKFKPLFKFRFCLYCLYLLIVHIGLSSIRLHFAAYANKKGTSTELSSFLVTLFGLGNTIARLSIGILTNKARESMYITNFLCCVLNTIISFIGPYVGHTYRGQVIFSLTFSFFGNGFQPIVAPIAIDLVGLELFNVVNAVVLMMSGIGIMLGPVLSGWIYDLTGTYFYTFLLGGCCYGIAAGLILTVYISRHCQHVTIVVTATNSTTPNERDDKRQ